MRRRMGQEADRRWGALAGAAALAAALTALARPLVLAAALWTAGPLPALQTALWWTSGKSEVLQTAASTETIPLAGPEAEPPAPAAAAAAGPDIQAYFVELQGEQDRPADAAPVTEKTYAQGSGSQYIPCGAGSIKNNTRVSAAEAAAAAAGGLPFDIQLDSDQPQVLVMHTHATETYRPAAGLWYAPGDGARTTDRARNMCAVGQVITDTLNAAGICTLHDETLNDYPSYTGSYANSRAVVQRYLQQYPSIKVVLDVHRDAIESGGARIAPVCTINGRPSAQVMLICGCDNGGSVRLPNWRQNLAFAAAWEQAMERRTPGLTRPVLFSYRFYNQDLTTGSLLIEVGGHGNTLNEALYAGQLAAQGLVDALLGSSAP